MVKLIIFYSFPAFEAICSFIIYKERIGMLEFASITMVLIGVGILFDFQLAGARLLGQVIALVGAAFNESGFFLLSWLGERGAHVE
jgi:drug/metabolite transporter (DMT)-like permease